MFRILLIVSTHKDRRKYSFHLNNNFSADGPPPPSYPAEPPQPYSYQYGVKDEYSGANFGASESSDTKVVSGTYTVALPDGRIQTVKYTADDYAGYVADVTVSNFP